MITNRAMVDYCTMTSFNPDWMAGVKADFAGIGKVSSARFLQYAGEIITTEHGSVLMGEGLNRSPGFSGIFKHFVTKWSGEIADGCHYYYREKECNVKRLDIQVTIKTDLRDIPGEMEVKLRTGHKFKTGKGRAPTPDLRRSNSSTLYYGSRSGDSFWRLYEKKGRDGEWYLRWEFELKRHQAEWAMKELVSGRSPGDLFVTLMDGYHESYEWYVKPFINAARGELTARYVAEDSRDTMTWLETLSGTVERVARSHQTRYRAVSLIRDWYDMVLRIESEG